MELARSENSIETAANNEAGRIKSAVDLAVQFGGVDGDFHKMWVIDQMIRILTGADYDRIIAEACNGEDGPETYEWDTGIAP
jgi:hypothetical protein